MGELVHEDRLIGRGWFSIGTFLNVLVPENKPQEESKLLPWAYINDKATTVIKYKWMRWCGNLVCLNIFSK